ncbi:MAG: hypothetical protein IJQ67_06760 [Bacilli bacterium]|nr:hypothetical protein [Bacilli bacterium]
MNKLLTKIVGVTLGLTMAIGVGVAVGNRTNTRIAKADTYTGTVNMGSGYWNPRDKWSTPSSPAVDTFTDNLGNTWTCTYSFSTYGGSANASFIQFGTSSNPASSVVFTTTLSSSQTISAFSTKVGGYSGTAGTINLKVGSTVVGTGSFNTTSDVTVNASNTTETGTVLTVQLLPSAKGIKVYNFSYTYSTGAADSITEKAASFDVYNGETLTLSTCVTTTGSGALSFSANTTSYGTITAGVFTASAVGGPTTITATKGSASTTFTICVLDLPTYSKVTSTANLTPGSELILIYDGTNGTLAANAKSGTFLTTTSVTISTNTIKTRSALVFTLGGTSGAWTLKNGDDYYGVSSASSNKLATKATEPIASDTGYLWTISFSSNKLVMATKLGGGNLQFNYNGGTNPRITNYTSVQEDSLYMFAILAPQVTPSVSSATIYTPNAPTAVEVTLSYKNITPGSGTAVTSSDVSVIPVANCVFTNEYQTLTISQNSVTGSSTITVNATDGSQNCSCTIAITVANNAATLSSISITTAPTNTTFYVGNKLDLSGMVVKASWSSGDPTDVTEDCVIYLGDGTGSAYDDEALVAENDLVTIKYTFSGTTKSTTQAISVVAFPYSVASSINGGDKVIIAAGTRYLQSIGDINKKTVGIAADFGNGIYPSTDNTYTIVAGSSDGTVAFKQGANYLSFSGSDNQLLTSTTLNAESSWTVSITTNIATITNVASDTRIIKYANGDRFAAYDNATATTVQLWKLNGASGQSAAEDFADDFKEYIVDNICAVNDASFDTDMAEFWELEAETYASLSSEAKAYIASKSANASGDKVEKMLAEYNHIYGVYGTSLSLSNFLSRVEAVKASNSIGPAINASQGSSTTTLVIILSIVGFITVGGYFLIRRRKEN